MLTESICYADLTRECFLLIESIYFEYNTLMLMEDSDFLYRADLARASFDLDSFSFISWQSRSFKILRICWFENPCSEALLTNELIEVVRSPKIPSLCNVFLTEFFGLSPSLIRSVTLSKLVSAKST